MLFYSLPYSSSCLTDGAADTSQAMNVSGLQLPTSLRTRTASMKLRSSVGGGGGGAHCEEDSSSSSLSITKEISFNDQSLVNARHGCPSSPDPLSQASHCQWSGGPVNATAVDVDAAAFKGTTTTTLLSHQQPCPTPATYSKRQRHSTVSLNSSSHHHSSHAKSPLKLNRREQKVVIITYSILPMSTAAVLWNVMIDLS